KCEVDQVFGFFYPFVNAHTDIDQQISRVRNPGEIAVWFGGARFDYETAFGVVRDDLARGYTVPSAVNGIDPETGRLTYSEEHPLLLIATHIVCAQRTSKNHLQRLFVELRNSNGWDVHFRTKEKSQGKSVWQAAKKTQAQNRLEGILAAIDI